MNKLKMTKIKYEQSKPETVKNQIPDPRARPQAPPPSIINLKRKLETKPPDFSRNIKTKEERVELAIWDRMTVAEIRHHLAIIKRFHRK